LLKPAVTTAKAVRIGNSKKESIVVNDEVFVKSTDIGKWNYIVEVSFLWTDGSPCTDTGKSATLEAANNWTNMAMIHDHYWPIKNDWAWMKGEERDAEVKKAIALFNKAAENGATEKRNKFGRRFVRETIPFTRTVTKIER